MYNYKQHIIPVDTSLSQALTNLEELIYEKILFVVDKENRLLGSITDGDIRRSLLKNNSINKTIESVYEPSPKFFYENNIDLKKLIELRKEAIQVIPIVDQQKRIVDIFNYSLYKSYLPVDTIIMAGGRGSRLAPLTDTKPKPLLEIGGKAIIEYNMDRITSYGVKNFWLSVNYLKEQIKSHFKNGNDQINIGYIEEEQPMGTIGSLTMMTDFEHEHLLITNSDILTNLDYEDFYLDFIENDADIAMVTIPYETVIPYGVVEFKDKKVLGIQEKPTFTHYSNAGIYLIKKKWINNIPKNQFYNATDLIEQVIQNNGNVISYPFSGYWLDVGKPKDLNRAKNEINSIKF